MSRVRRFNKDKVENIKPKVYLNIGALFDIPTASFIQGPKGDIFYNGGLSHNTGIIGPGGMYKSTLMHYAMLSACSKIFEAGYETDMDSYDTENNMDTNRLDNLASNFDVFGKNITDKFWTVTDTTSKLGNEWAKEFYEFMIEKTKDKNSYIQSEGFVDIDGKPIKFLIPTFTEIDSLTTFQTESVDEMLTGDLDNSNTNTYAMKQGIFKTKFMTTLPKYLTQSGTYILMTAHVGEKVDMNANPYAPQPPKKLQFLKGNTAIKGSGSMFTFLTTGLWEVENIKNLTNTGDEPLYPINSDDNAGTDLNMITVKILRSKNGSGSGIRLPIVVSQTKGVQPTLTEFHYLKTNNKVNGSNGPGYGMSGNNTTYHLDIYPNVNIQRTKIRNLIDNDKKLRRAINITSELLQLHIFARPYLLENDLLMTPLELYEALIKEGYNWDEILETRGYWLFNQYTAKTKFLSVIDLLRMAKGKYKPYWLTDKKNKEK